MPLENFLWTLRTCSRCLKGLPDLDLCVSKKIMDIRLTNREIVKETWNFVLNHSLCCKILPIPRGVLSIEHTGWNVTSETSKRKWSFCKIDSKDVSSFFFHTLNITHFPTTNSQDWDLRTYQNILFYKPREHKKHNF